MVGKILGFLIVLFFFLAPLFVRAEANINAGFVSGVWFSKEPFFAGEEIRVYGAVQNHSGFDILGALRFFDRGKVIGEKDFSALNGALIQEWVDWEVTAGEHEISVEIVDARRSEPGSGSLPVSLNPSTSGVSRVVVEKDTDGDGAGDGVDPDDDNDGVSDADEIKQGTDPLDPNNPREEKAEKETEESEGEENLAEETIDRAKDINEKIEMATEPTLDKLQSFFEKKEEELLVKIEDEKRKEPTDEEKVKGSLEKFANKLPPVFRVVYLWFLRLFIWIFSAWWKVLLVALEAVFLLKKVYNRFF